MPTPLRFWVLSDVCIDPRRSSSQLHVWQVMEGLLRTGHAVNYGYFSVDAPVWPAIGELAKRYPAFRSTGTINAQSVPVFDVLYLTNLWSADFLSAALNTLQQLRRHGLRFAAVFDSMDCLFKSVAPFYQGAEREALLEREAELRRRVNHCVLVSGQECRDAEAAFGPPLERYSVVAQSWDLYEPGLAHDWERRQHLCFVGAVHPSNLEALQFFLSQVFPRILQRMPQVEFHILGAGTQTLNLDFPPAVLRQVRIRGYIEDLDGAIAGYRLQVVPVLQGGGIKGKLLQSLACGTPVVSTAKGVEGMNLRAGREVLVADTAETLTEAVTGLYDDEPRWTALQRAGGEFIRRDYSRAVFDGQLRELVQRLRQPAA